MKVLLAASEAIPFISTGGLGEVAGSLHRELLRAGVDARLIMPLYRGIKEKFAVEYTGHEVQSPLGKKSHAFKVFANKGSAYFLECDEFFDRKEPYGTAQGDFEDNAQRFIAFSKAALETCRAAGFIPDVIHCHDWQTGLIPLYVKTLYRRHLKKTATLMTIHNLGYQGVFPASAMTLTGLDMKHFNPEGLEYYGQLNFLKAGIVSADAVSTVSGSYAEEIKTKQYGFGLDGVLRGREIAGIVNGIDYADWDPSRDTAIAANYDLNDITGKKKCKASLLKELSFADKKAPLAGMVGRLTSQKGIELLLEISDRMPASRANIVLIGKGDEALQGALNGVAKRHPDIFHFRAGYDDGFARRVFSASDMLLIPSKYEPCGLTQMIAMRYGTVPVARATGGLADTIKDYDHIGAEGTGFLFSDYNSSALEECLKRALCVFSDPVRWRGLARGCMKEDFSWKSSAAKYVSLYEGLSGGGRA